MDEKTERSVPAEEPTPLHPETEPMPETGREPKEQEPEKQPGQGES